MAREFGNTVMKAFYASLEAESPQTNNESMGIRPSEETQKAMNILRELVSNKFSLLLHLGLSRTIKHILKHLLSLPPDEGFSMRTNSLMLQLSQSFDQYSLDYENTKLKLESATADDREAEKVNHDLQANVQEFHKVDIEEKCLDNQLACLKEEKRELEEKINAKQAQIENVTELRDKVFKRKIQVFHQGRMIKAKRDDLRNQVSSLKAEQESAKIMEAKIEGEWSKLAKQFLDSTSF